MKINITTWVDGLDIIFTTLVILVLGIAIGYVCILVAIFALFVIIQFPYVLLAIPFLIFGPFIAIALKDWVCLFVAEKDVE